MSEDKTSYLCQKLIELKKLNEEEKIKIIKSLLL